MISVFLRVSVSRGSSPTVKEGSLQLLDARREPSLTVGLLPRDTETQR
jgi:hypothetical protein